MTLFRWLAGRSRSPQEPSEALAGLTVRLNDLQRRLVALEEDEAARELRLGKLAAEIKRHFKRVQELDRRAELREDAEPGEDDLDRELERMKLRLMGGGQ
ncbi:MAG TPA: hypothetical protein PLM62_17745 [Zoogloea sp.]|nr:hypothetical protein [Zoogloea sp.]